MPFVVPQDRDHAHGSFTRSIIEDVQFKVPSDCSVFSDTHTIWTMYCRCETKYLYHLLLPDLSEVYGLT
ncbi:hypothetical protein SAMN05444166_7272 [Singulisphaera sp. GP187]|nr:hypothetical protein SAMN05444166_7272 [Singulisphaera sp. GP187]